MDHARVIVLDKESIHDWVEIDRQTQMLFETGKMGAAYYSDIVRFLLLREYGGYWLDSTIFLARPLCPDVDRFWTVKRPSDRLGPSVSRQRWTSYALGGPAHHPVWSFMHTFLREYWHECDVLVDYWIVDYALDFAYDLNVGGFRRDVDALEFSNHNVWELGRHLNDEAEGDWRDEHWAAGTALFKLTHKEDVLRAWLGGKPPRSASPSGETIFGRVLSILNDEDPTEAVCSPCGQVMREHTEFGCDSRTSAHDAERVGGECSDPHGKEADT